jgi:PAS domain S-box-containing protein
LPAFDADRLVVLQFFCPDDSDVFSPHIGCLALGIDPVKTPQLETSMHDATDARDMTSINRKLFADQVHKQYEHTVFGSVATLINSLILAYILKAHAPQAGLLAWLVFAGMVSACRLILNGAYHKSTTRSANPGKWNSWFLITLFMSGVLWGSSSIFMFSSDSIGHQAFIAFVAGGMVAGAASSFTAVLTAFFIFSIPALLPIGISFFLLGDQMHIAMGSMIFLFLVIICLAAIRTHRNIIDLLSLKYQRTALIDSLREEIDQRKEAQKNLRRQKDRVEEIVTRRTAQLNSANQRLRAILNYAPLAIWAFNGQGVLTFADGKGLGKMGFEPDTAVGKSIFDLCAGNKPFIDISRRVLGGEFISDTILFDGVSFEVRYQPMEVDADSNIAGAIGVAIDVTEQTAAKEALQRSKEQLQRAQKMEALGTLAGGVAHDLNNILSGITSIPELLLMDIPKDSPIRRSLTIVKESGEKAAAVVQDLLTLARRGVPTYECLNVNQVIRRCLDSPDIAALLRLHSKINLTTDLQPDLFNTYGSSIHILKTVSNLIINAVEAMPEGGRLEISTNNRYADSSVSEFDTVEEGEYVVLSVSDSGVGISENDQSKIFEPFYTNKVMGRSGSGLGMAVVWGTVKDHGGYIDLQSSEGQGTRFDLFFPATRDRLRQDESTEALPDIMGNGEFVLVIDDIPTQREIATRILDRLGYRSIAFASGELAVEFLRANTADLIIIDMILDPGMDGCETYRKISSIRPGQKAIIASGYSETDRVKAALAQGAGKYVKKPYTIVTIGKAIKEVFANSGKG